MSDISDPQMGEMAPKPETTDFGTLKEALEFLDDEWTTGWRQLERAQATLKLFGHHVKELLEQVAKQSQK